MYFSNAFSFIDFQNRCFRPCPPCPQENCPPPPFECPCNDIHCPKKLKANKENVQKKKGCEGLGGEIGNINVCIDVTEDLEIEGWLGRKLNRALMQEVLQLYFIKTSLSL